MSDQYDPHRETNTKMLQAIGQPPPTSVLIAVLECTGGETPTHLSVTADWGDGTTAWSVVGTTAKAMFEVTASKAQENWWGGTSADNGDGDVLTARIYPLSTFRGAEFEAEKVVPGEFTRGDSEVRGSWTLRFASGEVKISTSKGDQHSDREDARAVVRHALEG